MDDPPTLSMQDGVATIDAIDAAGLRAALAAIPGVVLAVPQAAWALRVGPDRADALARLARCFALALDAHSRTQLDALVAARDPEVPGIEVVDDDGVWLSLIDDWSHPGVEELRALPGARARDEVGRTEVPVTARTAARISDCVERHELRLSPAAELALRELPTVTLDESGSLLSVFIARRTDLLGRVARMPGARSWGQTGDRFLLSASPEVAEALRELEDELTFDAPAAAWLGSAPQWIAHVTVARSSRGGVLTFDTTWGTPPKSLKDFDGLKRRDGRHVAPLSTANVRRLDALDQSRAALTWAPQVQRAQTWTGANATADGPVPAAVLDLDDEHGVLVVEPIWDDDADGALAHAHRQLARSSGRGGDVLPASQWPADALATFVKRNRLHCAPAVRQLIEGALMSQEEAQRLIAMSQATDADLVVEGLAGELMAFQRAGVAYALERRRLFVADEQGLGKTIQALATIQADGAYPAVVVCPASLKLNWLRETQAWLPQRIVRQLGGRTPQLLGEADIVVVNYDVLDAHVDALAQLHPRALVLDESHYVKNPDTVRARAALELGRRMAPDALRLALTGTPVVNRPIELAPQLRVLDRLAEFGSARSFDHAFSTGRSRRALHDRLRASCYLRRRKEDVLTQLPEKRRAVVTIPLDNEATYRDAERDFIRWLAEQLGPEEQLSVDSRAAALVRLTALRRLAAQGKLAAALSWIEDFGESGERLIVFAHHRDIQSRVLDWFPGSARLVGSDCLEEREANVRRFQADDGPSLCVCSLEVAAHGFTLTAAANVAFLELAWTPAKHDQAEDRVHRIGQERGVTAWYLLAADTIDERVAQILDEKRGVVDAITDGGDGTSPALVNALLAQYLGRSE